MSPDSPTAPLPAGLYRYRFEDVEFDEARNLLSVAGRPVVVEPLPLQLLALMLQRPDEAISRAELHDAIWQGRPTVDHVLPNAVSKLRRALGESAAARLVNLPRIGYRLRGPVERIAVGRRPLAALELAPGRPVPGCPEFLLVRRLGDATASTVWLARHRRLPESLVFKFAGDGDRLAALKREFTVCRLLASELGRRPEFVRLKDSNFASPPFYLAYADAGVDLRTWSKKDGRLSRSSPEERLRLFLKIAQGVAAAHSVGVLHRDLKPGNILIEELDNPSSQAAGHGASADADRLHVRLTDFGSSELLAPERLQAHAITAMGMTVQGDAHPLLGLTPHYLAPELLIGEATTTRSDLYALGLILYQILVGDLDRPLATGWESDIADPLLVEDLRAATEGRPERRLASVAQLIERLEALPVRRVRRADAADSARRLQIVAERLGKMRTRRHWLTAVAACIAIGGVAAAWFGVQARAAQHEAERATARAQAINDFLNLDVLRSANLRIDAAPVPNITLVDVLARASDRVSERFKGDPPVLAQVRRQLGDIYLGMHFADRAEDEYRRAITALESAGPVDGDEVLAARFGLVRALTATDRPQEAWAQLDAAERMAGSARPATAGEVVQRALRARIELLMDAQRPREALPLARRLVLSTDQPSSVGELNTEQRLEAREWLCEIYLQLGDTTGFDELLKALAEPPFNERSARQAIATRLQLRQARAQARQGRWLEAKAALVALRDAAVRRPFRDEWQIGTLEHALFEAYHAAGRFEDALQASDAAVRAYALALGADHSAVVLSRVDRAIAELDAGRTAEGLRDLEVLRPRVDANGRNGMRRIAIDLARARALTSLGRPVEAYRLLQDMELAGSANPDFDGSASEVERQAELGRARLASGETESGRRLVGRAIDDMRRSGLPEWQIARYRPLVVAVESPSR